jgi:hypothetical protein
MRHGQPFGRFEPAILRLSSILPFIEDKKMVFGRTRQPEALMSKAKFWTALSLAAATFMLGGCLVSTKPLITKGDHPFSAFTLLQNQTGNDRTVFVVRAKGDGYVLQQKDPKDNEFILVKQIAAHRYIIQISRSFEDLDHKATRARMYAVLTIRPDDTWYVRDYQNTDHCSDGFSPDQISRWGLTDTEHAGLGTDCLVPSFAALKAIVLQDLADHPDTFDITYKVLQKS